MSLTAAEVGLIVPELDARFAGLVIRKVYQCDPHTFAFFCHRDDILLVSVHPAAGRLHTVPSVNQRIPCRDFCRLMRKYLTGGRVSRLQQVHSDRVVQVEIRHRRGDLTLMAELTGRTGNLSLVDGEGRIVGSLKARGCGGRRFEVGAEYPPLPMADGTRGAGNRFEKGRGDLDGQVRRWFDQVLIEHEFTQARGRVGSRVRKELKRLQKLEKKTVAEQKRADEAAAKKKWADLILAHLHELPDRTDSVTVPDLFGRGDRLNIALDPRLSVKDNAQRFYKDHRRARRTHEFCAKRLSEIRSRRKELSDFMEWMEKAGSEDLARLREQAGDLGVETIASRAVRKDERKKDKQARHKPYRSFVSRSGKAILVGRTARDNHGLTFHVARGRDLWLHVADWPGPHVVVRLDTDQPIDQESLLDAATLAVYFSSAKKNNRAEVRYALRKFVRPVPGATGRVTVAGGKTLAVRMDPDRLNRLLGHGGKP